MSLFEQNQAFYNTPLLLSLEESKAPHLFIDYFAGAYRLWEIREFLADLKEAAITHPDLFPTHKDRKDILFFIEQLEMLAEAAYLQHKVGKSLKGIGTQ